MPVGQRRLLDVRFGEACGQELLPGALPVDVARRGRQVVDHPRAQVVLERCGHRLGVGGVADADAIDQPPGLECARGDRPGDASTGAEHRGHAAPGRCQLGQRMARLSAALRQARIRRVDRLPCLVERPPSGGGRRLGDVHIACGAAMGRLRLGHDCSRCAGPLVCACLLGDGRGQRLLGEPQP